MAQFKCDAQSDMNSRYFATDGCRPTHNRGSLSVMIFLGAMNFFTTFTFGCRMKKGLAKQAGKQ